DAVEQLGIERTREELQQADLAVVVREAGAADDFGFAIAGAVPKLDVYNKVDLLPQFVPPPGSLAVSAKTGQGIDALRRRIIEVAGWEAEGESVFLDRERHVRALSKASAHLE